MWCLGAHTTGKTTTHTIKPGRELGSEGSKRAGMILESGADVPWLPPLVRTAARRHRMYAAAPLPQIQVTQEMQHLKEQVGQIDQLLRSQHPQQTLNSLNAQRIQLMAKLQSIARQQQGAQMMQYPQGTPQQSISQAMQWMCINIRGPKGGTLSVPNMAIIKGIPWHCSGCDEPDDHTMVWCRQCNIHMHASCFVCSPSEIESLHQSDEGWYCDDCE